MDGIGQFLNQNNEDLIEGVFFIVKTSSLSFLKSSKRKSATITTTVTHVMHLYYYTNVCCLIRVLFSIQLHIIKCIVTSIAHSLSIFNGNHYIFHLQSFGFSKFYFFSFLILSFPPQLSSYVRVSHKTDTVDQEKFL